jgi:hypothetical protein
MAHWENWFWLSKNLTWQEFSLITDLIETPIKETTLPEFTKV